MDGAQEMLRRYLTAGSEKQAEVALGCLIREHAMPIIRSLLRRKTGIEIDYWRRLDRLARASGGIGKWGAPAAELDAEDLFQESVLNLIVRLRALRSGEAGEEIRDLRAYVGAVAQHTFTHAMRKRYPERHRLWRRLRELAVGSHGVSGFAMWPGLASGEHLYGFRVWEGSSLRLTQNYENWRRDPREFQRTVLCGTDARRLHLPKLVADLLDWIGGPMDMDHLVNGLGELFRVHETPLDPEEGDPPWESMRALLDVPTQVIKKLAFDQLIRALWPEIRDLPSHQRTALLLHLEKDVILLFVMHGCGSLRDVAALSGLSVEEFTEAYRRLPLPDAALADRLGATGRQVINYRKSARERLCRRLWARIDPGAEHPGE